MKCPRKRRLKANYFCRDIRQTKNLKMDNLLRLSTCITTGTNKTTLSLNINKKTLNLGINKTITNQNLKCNTENHLSVPRTCLIWLMEILLIQVLTLRKRPKDQFTQATLSRQTTIVHAVLTNPDKLRNKQKRNPL